MSRKKIELCGRVHKVFFFDYPRFPLPENKSGVL